MGTKKKPDKSQRPQTIKDGFDVNVSVLPGRNALVLCGALSFFINFILYIITLAPTVTFEDSGELISAVINRGVPHEPGYPLFILLGRFFSLIPVSSPAWRLNLMSAFFTAAAGAFVCLTTILLIQKTFQAVRPLAKIPRFPRVEELIICATGLTSAVLFGTARTCWEQAVITEVYGINGFLIAVFLFFACRLALQKSEPEKQTTLVLMSYLCGLAFANHTTSLMLIPFWGMCILFHERKLLVDAMFWIKSVLLFVVGLTPYAYLPIASRHNPVMDWGNPENLTNFFRVITRHQYNDGKPNSIESFLSQSSVFFSEFLLDQWVPIVLVFAVIGMIFLFRKNRPAFYFFLVALFFTAPVMTWMTNFDVSNPASAFENKSLVSVFYIPAYLVISILLGIGLFGLLRYISMRRPHGAVMLAGALCILTLSNALFSTMSKVSMRGYWFAQQYNANVLNSLPRNSLYFANWDPFVFPLMYSQFVEKKRPDVLVLDQMLLRRSWYVHSLQHHYPEITRQVQREINGFLSAVEPFESGKPYNGTVIQSFYIAMINAFIDAKIRMNDPVYFSYVPEPGILRFFHLEPQFFAYKYTPLPLDTAISDTGLVMTGFTDSSANRDRMAEYVRNYYGNLYALRGLQLDSCGLPGKARECFEKGRKFFNPNSQQEMFIDLKLKGGLGK